MPPSPALIFVSYVRQDRARVQPLLQAVARELRDLPRPCTLWIDKDDLKPGESWDLQVTQALESSIGLLVFVSEQSVQSDWIRQELAVADVHDKLIVPILLDRSVRMPPSLMRRQPVLYFGDPDPVATQLTAVEIARAVETYLLRKPDPRPAVPPGDAPAIAADIARDMRASVAEAASKGAPDSVFVVHGHDEPALSELETYLTSIGVTPIVLARLSESAQSLFQKFLGIAGQARFAIVLLSADDVAASRRQYDQPGVGERALQFRARQNVILELGFFYGQLGFESVFVVAAGLPVFPNFERPSDLDGVVFEAITDPGWKKKLAQRLRQGGFALRGA